MSCQLKEKEIYLAWVVAVFKRGLTKLAERCGPQLPANWQEARELGSSQTQLNYRHMSMHACNVRTCVAEQRSGLVHAVLSDLTKSG